MVRDQKKEAFRQKRSMMVIKKKGGMSAEKSKSPNKEIAEALKVKPISHVRPRVPSVKEVKLGAPTTKPPAPTTKP